MAITETWLYSDEDENAFHINQFVPHGYQFKHTPRQDGRVGGGVGLLHHKNVKVVVQKGRKCTCSGFTQFEYLETVLSITKDPRSNIRLIVVYRPPPTRANKLKIKYFWREWKKLLTVLARDHKKFIIVGDLNFHLDVANDPYTVKFQGILDDLNLVQLVKKPTHTAGHILDVVITQPENSLIIENSLSVHDPGITCSSGNTTNTHHFAISFHLNFCKPLPVYKTVSYRNIKNLNRDAFIADLNSCNLEHKLCQSADIDEMVNQFIVSTVTVIDKHAPILTKRFPDRPSNSWYTPALKLLKQEKRRLERIWIQSGLESHRLVFRQHCASYAKALHSARLKKTQEKVDECERDKGKLFKVCSDIVNLPREHIILEGCVDDRETAEAFSTFFKSKTETISSDLDAEASSIQETVTPNSKLDTLTQIRNIPKLSQFQPISDEDAENLICKSKDKSCSLDHVPPKFVKMFPSLFAPSIALIINRSMSSGRVPSAFKKAIVFPLLKKTNLDPLDPASYRPVSNLPYLSKLLEKAVYAQLERHLVTYDLLPASQSAYRKMHSTETSLLKLNNDILSAINNGRSTLLVTLDISSAFDTVNHQMLLQRYADLFGLDGIVLSWFASYLSHRSQAVQVGSHLSAFIEILCGFAQGSTLGGPKYIMFASPLPELIEAHQVYHEGYADDSNVYTSFDMKNHSEVSASFNQMEDCLSDVIKWMSMNRLKLNCSKTEAVVFHPFRTTLDQDQYTGLSIRMGYERIKVTHEIKSLGVTFDSKMTMIKHVNLTSRTGFFHLRRISKVRKQLSRGITETLVNSFITSRLDYCNSLLCSLPNKTLRKLQLVQNASAKLVMLKNKRDHVTPLLKELHWLPIKYRSKFKILVLTWKILHNMAPKNIVDLISENRPSMNLRSANGILLVHPRLPKNSAGHRAFINISPFLWNAMPSAIRQSNSVTEFKSKLKRHYFVEYFGS